MTNSQIFKLPERKLISVGGEEAEPFLQNILTCNLDNITEDAAGFGGLLTPQGKILFDFFVLRQGDAFILDVHQDIADDLLKRLTFYRLRAKVTLEILGEEWNVLAALSETNPDLFPEGTLQFVDPRLADMGWRLYTNRDVSVEFSPLLEAYHHHRIQLGIPDGGIDYPYGDAFPHEALYDQINGVDFSKGCYVGQEVVSRMHHRGTARKRFVKIKSKNALPEPGVDIKAGERKTGILTSVSNDLGIALLRLDHVGDALANEVPITAGEAEVIPVIQNWADFDWINKDGT